MTVTKVWLALVLAGCAVGSDEPPVVTIMPDDTKSDADPDEAAICAAAAALPSENACSLVCDPDAFKVRLIANGMAGGNCYQLRCELTAEMAVTVGVCLP